MTIGYEKPPMGAKSFRALTKLFTLLAVFVFLMVSGLVLSFGLTQVLLTPADGGFPRDFSAKPERLTANAAEYAELLAQAERTHPHATAQDLVDLYDKGAGVAQNPVLAAVFAWRAAHDNYFGLCTGQDDCGYAYRHDLSTRMDSKLSISEQEVASEIERERYPELIHNYRLYWILNTAILFAMSSIFILICWKVLRQNTRVE
jgi:hypothetical protein